MIALAPLPFPLDTPIRGLPFAAIDFEATGFAGPDAHVVEVAVVHGTFGQPGVTPAFSSLVRPGVPIPAGASRVHGILDEHVAGAPRWPDVEEQLAAATAGRLILAYSAPSDLLFWTTEAERHGTPAPSWPWLDLLVVRAASVARGRPGKLLEVARQHGIELDAHGATGDAMALAMVARPLLSAAHKLGVFREHGGIRAATDRYYADRRRGWDGDDQDDDGDGVPAPLPPPTTIGQLLAWQSGTALYQERSWADYRRKEGDAMAPACPWHGLYGVEAPTWGNKPRPRPCAHCRASVVDKIESNGARQVLDVGGTLHVCGR